MTIANLQDTTSLFFPSWELSSIRDTIVSEFHRGAYCNDRVKRTNSLDCHGRPSARVTV